MSAEIKKECYHCKAKEVKHFNFKSAVRTAKEKGLYICKKCWIKTWEERGV